MFNKIIKKVRFREVLIFSVIVFLSRKSFGQAVNFYFWKDDWAWLWSANYNPNDFFHSTVGSDWYIRTGLFMYPYVLYMHKIIQNSELWQYVGLSLKIINSIVFYHFVKQIFNKKYIATIGAFIFATYSGGIEVYTWYKLSALAITFVLISLYFLGKFINKTQIIDFVFSILFILLALCSNMGRSAGVIPVGIFWLFIELIDQKESADKKQIFGKAISLLLILYLLLIKFVNQFGDQDPSLLRESLNHLTTFFGIIGNLIKNPFQRYYELGYLFEVNKLGTWLGIILFYVGVIAGIYFFVKKALFAKYITLFTGMVFIFYFPNWIFGGGGISTVLGSGHRYLALSGLGIIGIWLTIISSINKKWAIVLMAFLILMNINYSRHLIDTESTVRNKYLVRPIYLKLNEAMSDDGDVQLIILDTPNILKSFVVGGWYPYTYAYYKGLTNISDFPVVIGYWDHGVQWLCADDIGKIEIQKIGGFGNNRIDKITNSKHIYAWSLGQEGDLKDRTNQLRSIADDCLEKNDKTKN